jgi:hypothetical protein
MRASIGLQAPRDLGRTVSDKPKLRQMWGMSRYGSAKRQSNRRLMTAGILAEAGVRRRSAWVAGIGTA